MSSREERELCHCGSPQRWAADAGMPVEYNGTFAEYGITSSSGVWHVMRYCFWCGGVLPVSERWRMTIQPSEDELQDALRLLEDIKTVTQLQRALGEPDELVEGETAIGLPESAPRFKTQFVYRSRWKTVDLYAIEEQDGRLQFALSGKFKGADSGDKNEAG